MKYFSKPLIIIAALAIGCTGHSGTSIPDSQPDMRGTITNLKRKDSKSDQAVAVVLVEATPGVESNYTRASIRMNKKTHIIDTDGSSLTLEQLREQQQVEIWFDGAVQESNPVQAQAATVRLFNDL